MVVAGFRKRTTMEDGLEDGVAGDARKWLGMDDAVWLC